MNPVAMALGAAVLAPVLFASKSFVKPEAHPARTYPAHDEHKDENVTIAADPYDTAEKNKIFTMDFAERGILPVFFVVTNDGGQPVSIARMEVTLITANRSKLTPITSDDLYRRFSNPQAQTRPNPVPIPLPKRKVKGTLSPKEMEEIQSSLFAARAVEPHTTQSGFLFFDIGDIASPLAHANIDITGVADANGNEFLYFEIAMDHYLQPSARP